MRYAVLSGVWLEKMTISLGRAVQKLTDRLTNRVRNSSGRLLNCSVKAGFPSPAAEDGGEGQLLNLNDYLVKHPAATFFVRVSGDSMKDAGIFSEDILVVDRSLDATSGSVVVAIYNGGLTVKTMVMTGDYPRLEPANSEYLPIEITAADDFEIWGVVTYVIHRPVGK